MANNDANDAAMGIFWLVIIGVVVWLIFGWSGYSFAPKAIAIDGSDYVACDGLIHVSSDSTFSGPTSYSVSFNNAGIGATNIRGAQHVAVTDVPASICKTMTSQNHN